MLSHGYIKNDFDVQKWAAPEFLEQACQKDCWTRMEEETTSKFRRPRVAGLWNTTGMAGTSASRDCRFPRWLWLLKRAPANPSGPGKPTA